MPPDPALGPTRPPDLPALAQKTLKELEGQGFPRKVSLSFLATAETLQCVVLSRAPGGACTDLIDKRYDLKSFQIKAKSCDWGPMSGFVCAAPPFNKNGSLGMGFNAKELGKYWEKLEHVYDDQADPWVSLAISRERMDGFLRLGWPVSSRFQLDANEAVCALASDKENSVLAEVVLVAPRAGNGDLVRLYYNMVFMRRAQTDAAGKPRRDAKGVLQFQNWEQVAPTALNERRIETDALPIDGAVLRACFDPLYARLDRRAGFPAAPNDRRTGRILLRPILGVRNPYPPYKSPDQLYKNAVSGDFDLFAIWPVRAMDETVRPRLRNSLTAATGMNYLTRLSDQQPTYGDRAWPLFLPMVEKAYALRSLATPALYIEFVPGYAEIGPLEDPEIGNINTVTQHAATWLNANVYGHYRTGQSPETPAANVAFHSDEGGRPGIDEIDYPFVLFAPRAIDWDKERFKRLAALDANEDAETGDHVAPVLVGERDDRQFATVLWAMQQRCWLALHYVWANQLCNSPMLGVQNLMRNLLIRQKPTAAGERARAKTFADLQKALADCLTRQLASNKQSPPALDPIGQYMRQIAALTLPAD